MESKVLYLLRQWYGIKSFTWYARARGYTFRVARKAADLDTAYHIRWKVYEDAGYVIGKEYPHQRMKDQYDAWSVNLLAFYRGKAVGTLRLTPLSKGSPVLELFRVEKWPEPSKTMEMGRFAVLPEARGERIVALGLLVKMSEWALREGIEWWVGYAPRPLLKTFHAVARYKEIPVLPAGERERVARQKMAGYFKQYEKWLIVFRIRMDWISAWRWRKVIR